MSRTSYKKTRRTIHSFKNISPTLESLIQYCGKDGYIAIGLSPSTFQTKITDTFKSNTFQLRLLTNEDELLTDEILVYHHTIAESKKSNTQSCIKAIENLQYVQNTYKDKLKELINEYSNGKENTFFNKDKETCLELIHHKIKDIKPIKSNQSNSKDYIEKRLYSYIINSLQILKIDFKELENLFPNATDNNVAKNPIDKTNNILLYRKEFFDEKFLPLIEEVKELLDYYNSLIQMEIEFFKSDMEDRIDEIETEYEEKIEELENEKNSRSQQEIAQDYVEYGTIEGPYLAYKEDAHNHKEQLINELDDEIKNEDRFNFGENIVSLNQEKIDELYSILGKHLYEGYIVHIYHLMSKYKKYKTSATKYYETKIAIDKDFIGKEHKLIDQAVYLHDIIQQYHSIFQTQIISTSLDKELTIKDFQIDVLNFEEIEPKSIENCLEEFKQEHKIIDNEYADMILFYKYYTHQNFWILLAGYYYDKFLQLTYKKRYFLTTKDLAIKIFSIKNELLENTKSLQSLLKKTLK